MMNYQEFKEKMLNELENYFTDKLAGYKVEETVVDKVNQAKEGFMLKHPDVAFGPTMYFQDLYSYYQNRNDFNMVMSETVRVLEEAVSRTKPKVSIETLKDYKGKVFLYFVNTEKNREMLKDLPHREFLDLSIVYRAVVDSDDTGMASFIIRNDMMKLMGATEEDLYREALSGGTELMKKKVAKLDDVMIEIMKESGMPQSLVEETMNAYMHIPDSEQVYLITNERNLNGSGVILYKYVLHDIAEKLGSDLLIIPSSIHEFLALSADVYERSNLDEMVKEVNFTQVDEGERLSNSVYRYTRETGKIDFAYKSDETI